MYCIVVLRSLLACLPKILYDVLLILKLNLLAQNQALRCESIICLISTDFPCRKKTLVSSANSFKQASGAQFPMSFTYRRNNNVPYLFIARQHTDARYSYSKSVRLSVRYVPVPDENGLTYRHIFHHTVAQSF